MQNMTKTETKQRKIIVVPEARLSFNWLLHPKVEDTKNEDGEIVTSKSYSATLIIPNSDPILKRLRALAKEVLKEKWPKGKPLKYQSPFVPGEERLTNEGNVRPEYRGAIVLNCKNNFRQPGMIDEDDNKIIKDGVLYAGCYIAAELTCFGWTRKGKSGISFGLENVKKVGDGERLSGGNTPEEAFKGVPVRKKADNSAEYEDDEDLGV
jgi:hypothetical protein